MAEGNPLWVLSSAPEKGRALYVQAAARCREHLCADCIAFLEQAAQLDPRNHETQYQLGICYGGGCRVHSLTSADIAVEHLRCALTLIGATREPALRASLTNALGNTYTQSSRLTPSARTQNAILCYETAASLWLTQGDMLSWAMAEFNLGNACCELPVEEFPDKWDQAVRHYENALHVRTRESNPERHAATLENLGTAYRELPTGNRAGNVRKAVGCYRQALRIYTSSALPLQNAGLHNNLANAYLSLPADNPAATLRNVHRALRHFDRALRVRPKTRHPGDYASSQFNRGSAFLRLATASANPLKPLQEARSCFREARKYFSRCGQDELADRAKERLKFIRPYLRAA
jgi:tetratricopeptide (TPR) repeat protein